MKKRFAFSAAAAALLAFALVAVLTSGSEADDDIPSVETIAKRVEDLRGIKFKALPKVENLTKAELEEKFAGDAAKLTQREKTDLANSDELGRLLGFVSRRAPSSESSFANADGILGVYDDRTKTLVVVKGAQGNPRTKEMTIAHELTHALEDQAFGLNRLFEGSGEAQLAKRALAEGSAMLTEQRYSRKHLKGRASVKRIARRPAASTEKGQPDYYLNSDRFAYLDGARYAARLLREGGQDAVDAAFRRPPQTTEEILHPDATVRQERVPLAVKKATGGEFERLIGGTFGEFDTSQLLLLGAIVDDETTRKEAAEGASGWAGGRFELWRAGGKDDAGCSKPCIERDLLAVAWRMDSPEQAAALADGLEPYLERFQRMKATGAGAYEGKAIAASVITAGDEVRMAIGPSRALTQAAAAPREN